MSGTIKTVKINGVAYDASTGLPIKRTKTTSTKPSSTAKAANVKKPVARGKTIRKKPSRSTTLKRTFVHEKTLSKSTKTTKLNCNNKIKVTNVQPKDNSSAPSRSKETITVTTVRHPMVTHFPVSRAYNLKAPKEESLTKTPTEQASNLLIDKFDDLLNTVDKETDDVDFSTETNFEIPDTQTHKGPKIAIIITAIVTLLSIIGILIILNLYPIQMFIASARTGIPGSLPSYTVSGFAITSVTVTSELNIKINYQNNTGQNYSIQKSKTKYPDTALQFNNYQTIATVIKNNMLYTISYDHLDKTQVQNIAENL